jgi:hypothetical protein
VAFEVYEQCTNLFDSWVACLAHWFENGEIEVVVV